MWGAKTICRWATNLGGGSTQNGRDSVGRRLGIKRWEGNAVKATQIIVRQRGTKWLPGENVFVAKDHTLHAAVDGTVRFDRHPDNGRSRVNVVPAPRSPPLLVNVGPLLAACPNTADGTWLWLQLPSRQD